MSVLESIDYKIHGIIQRHHESRHVGVGNCDGLALHHLLYPQRNHGAAACHYIAIARAADGRCGTLAQFTTFGNGNLLHQSLGDTHGVDRISSLVGRENDDVLDAMFNSALKDIARSDDVRAGRLHREELAGGNLLKGCSREDVVNTAHGNIYRSLVADIADVILHFRTLEHVTHVILFLLVTRENTNFFDVAIEEATKYGVSETACTACNQQDFVFENGHNLIRH